MTVGRNKIVAVLGALVLALTACGSDGEPGEPVTLDDLLVEEDPMTELGAAVEPGPTEAAEPTSMAELEAVWADNRARTVERIEANGWGVDPATGVLSGPGGFTVDLGACPQDWDPTAGITAGSISIGQTVPLTGPVAGAGYLSRSMEEYYAHVNEQGGIGGRELLLTVTDDEYVPARTVTAVREMVAADLFAISMLGSSNVLAVYEDLNRRCIPQPFVITGHPAWGDPLGHPWTTPSMLPYSTEALLWANWIVEQLDPGLTVGAVVMDNEMGRAYEATVRDYAASADGAFEFVSERHDAAAGSPVGDAVAAVAAHEPDVLLAMTTGDFCPAVLDAAAAQGLVVGDGLDAGFVVGTCKDVERYMTPDGSPGAGDGWLVAGGGIRQLSQPDFAGSVFGRFIGSLLDDAGLDHTTHVELGNGFFYAWAWVEALRIADELEGGLTRPNLLLALRAMDLEHPMLLHGISFSMDGNSDVFPVEGSGFSVFEAGPGEPGWRQLGGVIDLDGTTRRCAYDPVTGLCG
ncbi:MAG: ABC transporter substrate-binding protein [Actinomycetota bacterium]|nr:ABC transporter substrate-binding protein [Actinomycetota bacterium]